MPHIRFQEDFSEGSIELQCNVDSDGEKLIFSNIHLKGNSGFNTGLPSKTELRYSDTAGEYQFYYPYFNSKGETIYEWSINDFGRVLIAKLFKEVAKITFV